MKTNLLFCGILFLLVKQNAFAQNPQLWGTTSREGTALTGTVFKVNGDGTGFTTVHACTLLTRTSPIGGLLKATNGKLYGTTTNGGTLGDGTIFNIVR